ncbi:TPA: hybrid sensor histidine kinase/response regulator [Legionella pneumophila]|uniref:histidine kinase n=4 Tax=Gammaproteobacteria TaxID=1236 RepID=Q5ZU95_LEGPH|nr:hybrid sensor histidine kinase/response regulator [Legionella pneumophila]AAU27982.1 sensory box histidine kinase/response regulator [Legionella pneumophila subsp. pneumophila str. Philadelphia 1]AEW52104.1 sensory box histidine kinase/response regulator [Legionella pneumophila subsp. pneumophila ATCC 43290]AGN14790.1 two-component system, NarL family, sensor histidine kinase BarA [Legionella pneumophila subsp. pneumophila str. Thunder Bay]MCK0181142.1 hybrid sensor histidine kinase/response
MLKSIGIKYQLRITTLIPAFLVALLFAFFYNGLFGKDLKQHMSRLGEAYIRQLLPAAQYAMLRNDYRTLQGLINASTINPEVKALAFYNADGRLIAYRGGKHSIHKPFNPPDYTGDYIESKQINPFTINFIAPITIPKFNLYSSTEFKELSTPKIFQADDILGWLSIDIDTQSLLIKRYQMLIVTIFITLFGLLMGLTIHYFLSKRIYMPIARLRRSMKQILSNEFETEIRVSSPGELGIIEKGCAHLQRQYLNTVRDLNHHIEIATADLQQSLELLEEKNIELSLEKKKTEEKSRQKSEFIANMSHEIRTPMNGVIGFTNVLLESKLDPLQLDYVKTIKSSAQDLLSIINDILDFSKIDAGKLNLDCIPLDIRGCIDEVLSLASPNAHKKGIDLIPITDINVPKMVLGDPLRIKQIISNLVTNAVKFTDHGYVLIRTKIEQETDKDYTLLFAITDTGIGISPEDQTKLFTAFNQADTSITRRYGGSGLGLVICKKLCEEMHGRISLTSEINKGSTFSARIKVEKLVAYEIEKNQTHRFAHLKIICFDDNPLHLEAIGNGLGFWGIEAIRVDSFNKLSRTLTKHKDCKIAFINVNQGCERQAAELIAKHKQIPFVLISKWPINDFAALGARGFLYKPISIQKLQDLIESIANENQTEKNTNQELDTLREQLRFLHPEILIAEDNPVNKMLLTSLLNNNANITTVDDGEMAVTACEDKKFDMILLDLHMPKLNGLEAAKMIRQKSLMNKHSPIVLITASSSDLSSIDMKKYGVDFCFQKPIDEKQLLIQILRIVDKTKHAAIDWQLCVQKVSGNQALAEEFLAKFIEELYKNREEFIGLMHQKNVKGLADLAHKLHGACCFCGVPILQKRVAQLERLARRTANADNLTEAFTDLIQSIDAVISEYENQYSQ